MVSSQPTQTRGYRHHKNKHKKQKKGKECATGLVTTYHELSNKKDYLAQGELLSQFSIEGKKGSDVLLLCNICAEYHFMVIQ